MSTVKARLAGVASVLPAASAARTSNVWAPLASAGVVCGEVQVTNAAPSTRHWKVASASLENVKVGVESFVVPVGPVLIVVSGGVVSRGGSIVQA